MPCDGKEGQISGSKCVRPSLTYVMSEMNVMGLSQLAGDSLV